MLFKDGELTLLDKSLGVLAVATFHAKSPMLGVMIVGGKSGLGNNELLLN